MKLYIGSAFAGQSGLARTENPGAVIWDCFHETVRAALQEGKDPRELALELIRTHPDAVVVCDEVGSGVVPLLKEERAYREAVGRALCLIAGASNTVTRVVCGIPVKIK